MYPGILNDLVGKEIEGFAEGEFGDSYDDKIIVMNGYTWVIALNTAGDPLIAYFDTREDLINWLEANQKQSD